MKVNIERDIDVERLLINLNEKSKCSSVGMAGYDVTVSKQMLRDAHDVIKQFTTEVKKEPRYKIGQVFYMRDRLYLSERRYMEVKGLYQITKIEEDKVLSYHIKNLNSSDTFAVAESVLDNNELINCQVVICS